MLSSIKDAETGARGYLLTNNENFLKPYLESRKKVDSVLAFIRDEISDSESEKQRLDALGDLIRRKFNLLHFAIDYFPKHDFQITDTLTSVAYIGKEIMDGSGQPSAKCKPRNGHY
jgi:CHASE3 domain sensor protein